MSQLELHQRLEEYLDDALAPDQRQVLEADLARDPAASRLLMRLKSERAVRTAAYESYMPTQAESSRFAAKVMMTATAPVGFVGPRWRRMLNVAAGFIILAGTFAVGYMSANARTVEVPTTVVQTEYSVVATDGFETKESVFQTVEERNAFIKNVEQRGTRVAGNDSTDELIFW